MGVPEYQQILFVDDNLIVPLGPMVGRNVSRSEWVSCFRINHLVTWVSCLLYDTSISEISMVYLLFLCNIIQDLNEYLKLVTRFPCGFLFSYHVILVDIGPLLAEEKGRKEHQNHLSGFLIFLWHRLEC